MRRFRRWLDNDKIEVCSLYGPLIQPALAQWGEHVLYVALDTSMLWNTYCMIRIAVIYRGRAIPLVWLVREHGSAQVGYDAYKDLLDKAVTLLPVPCTVVFLADRGFADTDLMAHLHRLGWHWRIRIKTSFWLYRRGRPRCKVERLAVARGQAGFWPRVCITAKRYGPVPLAVARPHGGTDVCVAAGRCCCGRRGIRVTASSMTRCRRSSGGGMVPAEGAPQEVERTGLGQRL